MYNIILQNVVFWTIRRVSEKRKGCNIMKTNFLIGMTVVLCACVAGAEPNRIGVLTDGESDFWTSVRDAMQAAAAEQQVEVDFRMPDAATVERQNALAKEMVDAGIKAFAISPVNAQEQLETLKEIAVQIPVITLMTDASDCGRAAYIARDETKVGRLLGEGVLKNLPPGMKVMVFCKNQENPETKARIEGMREIFKMVGTVIDSVKADKGDRMIAKATMEEVVSTRPEISALIGLEDYHGQAMIGAVKKANRARMVRIIGFGATPEEEEALKTGIVHALVVDDAAEWGALVLKTLSALAQGVKEGIPEGGFISAPLKSLQTEVGVTVKELENEMQVQAPWVSQVTPKTP